MDDPPRGHAYFSAAGSIAHPNAATSTDSASHIPHSLTITAASPSRLFVLSPGWQYLPCTFLYPPPVLAFGLLFWKLVSLLLGFIHDPQKTSPTGVVTYACVVSLPILVSCLLSPFGGTDRWDGG